MPRVHVPLGNLRAVVILIVVAFHAVLPYLASQPAEPFAFDVAPYRWVAFPIIDRERFVAGYSLEDVKEGRVPPSIYARNFIFQAGQPEEITRAYHAAMGMDREPALGRRSYP